MLMLMQISIVYQFICQCSDNQCDTSLKCVHLSLLQCVIVFVAVCHCLCGSVTCHCRCQCGIHCEEADEEAGCKPGSSIILVLKKVVVVKVVVVAVVVVKK